MNKLVALLGATLIAQISAHAFAATSTSYTFAPTPADLWDLDHYYYYRWIINNSDISAAIPETETITSASLTFTRIRNWTDENDILRVYLVDYSGRAASTARVWDNQDRNSTTYLNGLSHALVGTWSDDVGPYGASAPGSTGTFTFDSDLLAILNNYAADGNFGFVIDPDCHYYNEGISFNITTEPRRVPSVPEGGATAGLLGLAMLALFGLRGKMRA